MLKKFLLFSLFTAVLFIIPQKSFSLPGEPFLTHTLDNGLSVVTKEDHSKNLIAICIYVKGGSRTETPDISGLSHYYEHLIFRGGTEKQKELETRKVFQALGTFYGFTSDDVTCYYIISTKENLEEALWRYADAVMNVEVTQEKVDKERQVVLEEMYMDNDRPDYRVYYLLFENAYKVHTYKITPIGLEKVIKTSNLEKFKTFYEERYVPNQMVMACVGDFDTPKLLAKIKQYFGGFKKGKDSFELGLVEPEQTGFREAFEKMNTQSSYLMLGFHIPEASHPDLTTLEVLNKILSDGQNSRLYKALKQKENLVLSYETYSEIRKDPGMFLISAQLTPVNEDKVVKNIFAELQKFATADATFEELAQAKEKLKNAYVFGTQSFIDQAQRLCFYAANSDLVLEPTYLDQIEKVSLRDIKQAARKYLKLTNCTLSMVRPKNSKPTSYKTLAKSFSFPAPERILATTNIAQKISPANGLTIILREDHSSPVIALEAYIKGGLLAEEESQAGIANLASRLLLKGTKKHTASEIDEIIAKNGLSLSAGSSEDYSSVSLLAASEKFKNGLDLVAEILNQSTFPDVELKKTKSDVISEIDNIADRSYDLTNLEFAHLIYGNSPYSRSLLGTNETVQKLERQDLQKFYSRTYVLANMVLAVVGDFKADDMASQMKAKFANWPKATPPKLKIVSVPSQTTSKEKFLPIEKTQITFNLGRMGVGIAHPDYWTLKVVERILSRQLFFKYVYEEGIAYRMWTYMRPRVGSAAFTFEMGVSPQNFEKGKNGIVNQLKTLLDKPVPKSDFEVAKKNLVTNFYLSQETASGQAKNYAFYESCGLGYQFVENFATNVNKVTLNQVKQAARKYLDPEKMTFVVVGKSAQVQASQE